MQSTTLMSQPYEAPSSPKHEGEPTSLVDPFGDLMASNPESLDFDGKLGWLRSQIIGQDAEFESPFGRRRITYCDHTASGRLLSVIEDYLQTNVYPFYGNTHTGDSHVGLRSTRVMIQAARYVKRCMGGGPHDILLFCGTGCTAAIKRLQEVTGLVVPPTLRSMVLEHLPPSDRWVVFVGPYEHHSNLLSWRQSLAEIVEIGLNASGGVDVAALETKLRSPEYAGRRKMGAFSAGSNVTGVVTDTRAIARVLHQHGAYACFDFACSGPYVKIDMRSGEADGYDAVFLSPHKFVGGPGSPGILLIREELYGLKGGPPSTSGGGTVHFVGYENEDTLYYTDPEEREDAGTPAIIQKVRVALALRVKEYLGPDLIWRKEEELVRVIMARLSANPNLFILASNAEDRQPVLSFIIYPKPPEGSRRRKSLHCRLVTLLLNDLFGIQARGGCACAGPYVHNLLGIGLSESKAIRASIQRGYESVKPGFTRINFGYYAPPEEIEFALGSIEFVARYGHRFLALYDLDWRSASWSCRNPKVKDLLGVVRSSRPMAMSNGKGTGELKDAYAEYMSIATSMAEALPDEVPRREVPDDVDPNLVFFM